MNFALFATRQFGGESIAGSHPSASWRVRRELRLLEMCPALLALLVTGCNTAKVTSEQTYAPAGTTKPEVVYVADFALGVDSIHHQDGMLSGRRGPVGRVGNILSGAAADDAARGRELVELMSTTLLEKLAGLGLKAVRIEHGATVPARGWLLRGAFLQVQEGNRLQRSFVGFGHGQTDVQVVCTIDDLSQGTPKPLYEMVTEAASGAKPGAAPTLVVGPYGAAARFVMAGDDLNKNVRHTATQIAGQTYKQIHQGK